jgi:hypothetical protein
MRVLANDGGRATTRETARRARGDRAQAEISQVSRFWNMGTLLIESTSCPATVWSVKSRECVLAWRGRLRFWIGAHLLIRRESHEVSKWTQSFFYDSDDKYLLRTTLYLPLSVLLPTYIQLLMYFVVRAHFLTRVSRGFESIYALRKRVILRDNSRES